MGPDVSVLRAHPWVQLAVLVVAAMAGVFSRTALGPVQESLRIALHLTDNQIALLQGAALALPLSLAAVPLGLAADRYSRARLMLAAIALAWVGTVLTALAHGFALLFVSRCLVGFAAPATAIIAFSLLADLYPPRRRGRATMMVVLGQSAGSALAFALGGQLAALAGPGPDSWRWALLGMALGLLPIIPLVLLLREPQRTGAAVRARTAQNLGSQLWACRGILSVLLGAMCLVNLADGAVLVWAAPSLSRRLGLPPGRVGAIMASSLLIGGFLGPLLGGLIADSCQSAGGPRRTVAMLGWLALLSAPMSFFAMTPGGPSASVPLASVMLVIFMIVGTALSVMTTAVSIVVIPNELLGLCVSLKFAGAVVFGLGLAPLIVSLLAGMMGGPAMIGRALACLCAAASLSGAIMFAIGRRYFPNSAPTTQRDAAGLR